jgi:hypothetical protein
MREFVFHDPLKIYFNAAPYEKGDPGFLSGGMPSHNTGERVVVGNSKSFISKLCRFPRVFMGMTGAPKERKVRRDLEF